MAKIVTAQNGARRTSASKPSRNLTPEIEKLAYQFFVERGYQHGFDQEDWARAESIIKKKYA